ncbi:MAG TPA: branched-chain amino acid transaminase [Candidatus Paceibacterota bacterium]|nr:branched-chain amino acid transaminase [Candidatus Paceibacterota bacterium]
MQRTVKIWYNGKFVDAEKAQTHVLTHALHYGSGAFEGIRAYLTPRGPAVFRLKDHVDRLFHSAAAFGMRIPYMKREIARAILETVAKNKLANCYIRPIVFYGAGKIAIRPTRTPVDIAIAAFPWEAYFGVERMLKVSVSRFVRFHPKSIVPGTKISGLYAVSVFATVEARKRGMDEVILLDHEGNVAEGPGENVFIVKNGKLFTPDSPSILPGITRASILSIAKHMKIPAAEKKISPVGLRNADEVFFTGTATEVAPIGMVNGKKIGNGDIGPVTAKLHAAYLDAARGKLPRYRKWLTPA